MRFTVLSLRFSVVCDVVWQRAVDMQQLLAYLTAGHMIVILVNAATLQGQDCTGAFRGHYIALTGVDKANETVSYLDPSFANGKRIRDVLLWCYSPLRCVLETEEMTICLVWYAVVHTVKVDLLERARLSPGTDQDMIVVFR